MPLAALGKLFLCNHLCDADSPELAAVEVLLQPGRGTDRHGGTAPTVPLTAHEARESLEPSASGSAIEVAAATGVHGSSGGASHLNAEPMA